MTTLDTILDDYEPGYTTVAGERVRAWRCKACGAVLASEGLPPEHECPTLGEFQAWLASVSEGA